MKGVIFTEFSEMVETTFGFDVLDQIIEASHLSSKGEYTAVGTYDHQEIVSLVLNLSKATDTPVPNLLKAFGEYLFGRFVTLYPNFFEKPKDGFDFLESVENYIHVEVRKLYLGAELPKFDCERIGDSDLKMVYHSGKHLEDIAEGLIKGCVDHYNEDATIDRETEPTEDGGIVFWIRRKA